MSTISYPSAIVTIRGVTLNETYSVVGEYRGRTQYGITHVGTRQNWNDSFVANLQNIDFDTLDLVLFINDSEAGRGTLSFMDVVTSPQTNLSTYKFIEAPRIELRKGGSVVGYLETEIVKSIKEDVVGGLKPPIVSLRNGEELPVLSAYTGFEKVRASNLNFFSCMDDKNKGWEFYPYSFQTKLKGKIADH